MGQESLVISDPVVVVGRIGAPYGVKGWVHVQSYTQPSNNISNYKKWVLLEGERQNTVVPEVRIQGKNCVAKLGNCETREAASGFTNQEIGIFRSELPLLEEGDYYWTDLVGLQVVTEEGQILGEVDHLFETGSNDVLSIKGEDKEHLVPYLDDCVLGIDLDTRVIRVRWDPEF